MSVALSVAFLEHHILILCKNANQQFKESFACKDLDKNGMLRSLQLAQFKILCYA